MENTKLTIGEIDLIIESLRYKTMAIERTEYPSHEFKLSQLNAVEAIVIKLREMKKLK